MNNNNHSHNRLQIMEVETQRKRSNNAKKKRIAVIGSGISGIQAMKGNKTKFSCPVYLMVFL